MKEKTIALLSGKGGTGKTTMAVNLSRAAGKAVYMDCDVEEPNGNLYLKSPETQVQSVTVGYPEIRKEKCTNCGACSRFCRFHAFLSSSSLTIAMPELCHDCGGCQLVCPADAIIYHRREIGTITRGISRETRVITGALNVGELSGVRIIHEMRSLTNEEPLRFIDSPPGSACSAVAAVEGVDLAVIVTEPTPFGISDMAMVVEMLEAMSIPLAVIINKAGLGNKDVYDFCSRRKLTILGELPFSRETAEISSRGELLFDKSPEYQRRFRELLNSVLQFGEGGINGN